MFIDIHQDIAENALHTTGKDFFRRNGVHEGSNTLDIAVNNQVDHPRAREAGLRVSFGVVFPIIMKKENGRMTLLNAQDITWNEARRQMDYYYLLAEHEEIHIMTRPEQLEHALSENGHYHIWLHAEGGEWIDEDLQTLHEAYGRGLRSLGLVWNLDNALGGGTNSDKGLTNFGRTVIETMNDLGMLLDTAHMNDVIFAEAAPHSQRPLINTHTSCRALQSIRRNITDEQMRVIAESGGVVGMAMHPGFAADNPTREGVLKHFLHAINSAGEDHVCIGSDFDGTSYPKLVEGLEHISDVPVFLEELARAVGSSVAEKVAYRNVQRVMQSVLA